MEPFVPVHPYSSGNQLPITASLCDDLQFDND
jgi:hypothetical protein